MILVTYFPTTHWSIVLEFLREESNEQLMFSLLHGNYTSQDHQWSNWLV